MVWILSVGIAAHAKNRELMTYEDMTGGWFTSAPELHEDRIELTPEHTIRQEMPLILQQSLLNDYFSEVVARAFLAGKRAGKAEIRKAIFN